MTWEYEKDETILGKHNGTKATAEIVPDERGDFIGKCPKEFDPNLACELLNSGIEVYHPRVRKPFPRNIYAVHNGVLYRAMPTNPGRSYHGFPELPAAFQQLPKQTRQIDFNRRYPASPDFPVGTTPC